MLCVMLCKIILSSLLPLSPFYTHQRRPSPLFSNTLVLCSCCSIGLGECNFTVIKDEEKNQDFYIFTSEILGGLR
jgi:hypothetical protein